MYVIAMDRITGYLQGFLMFILNYLQLFDTQCPSMVPSVLQFL